MKEVIKHLVLKYKSSISIHHFQNNETSSLLIQKASEIWQNFWAKAGSHWLPLVCYQLDIYYQKGISRNKLLKMILRNLDLTWGIITNVEEMYGNHEAALTCLVWNASYAASTCRSWWYAHQILMFLFFHEHW